MPMISSNNNHNQDENMIGSRDTFYIHALLRITVSYDDVLYIACPLRVTHYTTTAGWVMRVSVPQKSAKWA